MRNLKNKPILLLILFIVVSSFIFMIFNVRSHQSQEIYVESDRVPEAEEATEAKKEIETKTYTDEKNHFSIEIPTGWNKIDNNGTINFIHPDSGSTIEISIKDYSPDINNKTQESVSAEVATDGKTFISFNKVNSSHYESIYQDMGTTNFDYLDEVFWNLDKEVHLLCICDDKNYDAIKEYYQTIIDSFAWTKDAPNTIDPDYEIFYNANIGFQFGYPIAWTPGTTDSTFYASDESTGNSLSVYSIPYEKDFEHTSANDIAYQINQETDNFTIQSYDTKDNVGHMKCTIAGNQAFTRDAYVMLDGINAYFLVFDYQEIDEKIPKTCASYFRTYAKELKEEQERLRKEEEATATTDVTEQTTQTQGENVQGQENTEQVQNPEDTEPTPDVIEMPEDEVIQQ